MIRAFFIFFIFVTLNAKEYNLDELILYAIKNSPDAKIQELNVDISKTIYNQNFSGYLPKVNLNLRDDYIKTQDFFTSQKDLNLNLLTGTISLNQLIYDFGKTGGLAKSSKKQIDVNKALLKQKLSDIKKDVKLAYYDVLKKEALILVNKEALKLNEAQLYLSEQYFKSGIRTKVDVSDSKVRVLEAKINLENSKYDLKKAFANLDRVIGYKNLTRDYTIKIYKFDANKVISNLPKYDLNLTEAIDYAYKNKPQILALRDNIASNKAKITFAKSNNYPSIYFNANYQKQSANKYKDIFNSDMFFANVNLNWNLYKGNKDKNFIQEQKINYFKSQKELESLMLQIKQQVTRDYVNMLKARKNVFLSKSLMDLAKEKFEQVSKQYENGLSDYIKLQEARQSYIDAKSILVINYYNYFTSIANLDNTIGR